MLTCENVSIKVDEKCLINNLSFTCLPGSVLYIRGINGSGKTSLLRALSGIQKNYNGVIKINGKNISELEKPFSLYVGHNSPINMDLSVIDNIVFWSNLYGSDLMLRAAVHYWRLDDILDVKCHKLSAGYIKKISLARLMCCNSDVWLLDEVENNLDQINKKLLFDAIKIKSENGGITLISSHFNNKESLPHIDLRLFN